MKKYIKFLIFLLSFICSSNTIGVTTVKKHSSTVNTKLYKQNEDGLQGKVKTFTKYETSIKFGDLVKGEISFTRKYNIWGKECGRLIYNSWNGGRSEYKYTFDNKGNLLSYLWYNDGDLYIKEIYKYEKGLLSSKVIYKANGDYSEKETYSYNSQNRLEKMTRYNENGNPYQYFLYFYNLNFDDKLNLEVGYEEGRKIYEYEYKYDSFGNRISLKDTRYSEKEFLGSKLCIVKYTYKYNSKNQLIEKESTYSNSEKIREKCVYNYDSKGNVIEKLIYTDGVNLEKIKFQYDSYGNVVKELVYSGEAEILTSGEIYEYEYY